VTRLRSHGGAPNVLSASASVGALFGAHSRYDGFCTPLGRFDHCFVTSSFDLKIGLSLHRPATMQMTFPCATQDDKTDAFPQYYGH
jgi:hypothetical protein